MTYTFQIRGRKMHVHEERTMLAFELCALFTGVVGVTFGREHSAPVEHNDGSYTRRIIAEHYMIVEVDSLELAEAIRSWFTLRTP